MNTNIESGDRPLLCDFHRPRHLYSWKTLLSCGRSAAEIKRCLRENRGVAITLFRN